MKIESTLYDGVNIHIGISGNTLTVLAHDETDMRHVRLSFTSAELAELDDFWRERFRLMDGLE